MDQTVADARDAFGDAKQKRTKAEDEKILEAARSAFEEADEAEADNRRDALDDIKFARLGQQWPEEVEKGRRIAKRPCLTINKQPAFIRQVVNDGRQNRPSIKVSPADGGADVATAEVMNGLIRNIEYTSNADVAYDTALECAVDGGYGYLVVRTAYAHDDSFDLDIRIERISNRFRVWGDPRSDGADTSDWNVGFIADMMSLESFRRQYKGAEPVDWDGGVEYDGLKDPWRDGADIRVAEYWTRSMVPGEIVLVRGVNGEEQVLDADVLARESAVMQAAGFQVVGTRKVKRPKVMQHIITGAEVLETHEWLGRYIPISACYGDEVNVEGKRHLRSLIRDAKDAQRMFNYWRTTTTELVALAPKAPFVGPKGVFSVDPRWKTANTDNHTFLEFDPKIAAQGGPPQRQAFAGVPAGALQEALNASDDMKAIIGIYDASLGARSNETSGVAINARQREGDVSTFHFIDNLSRCIRHTGRILLDIIPKVYTTGRVVRILGVDGSPQNVTLGQPSQVTMPSGQPAAQIFDLAAGKYDLTVQTGPSFTTKRQESAAQMVEFVRAFPQVVPLIGDLIAKNLDWPGADEIAARLKAMLPPQIQGQNPQLQQMQQQMQAMDQQAKQAVQQLQGELQKAQAALQKSTTAVESEKLNKQIDQQKNMIDFYGEVTKRMQAGLPVVQGAEADPQLMQMATGAQQQVEMGQAQQQANAAQQQQAVAQTVMQAVAAMSEMTERLSQPRQVQRDENGLITMH